MEKWNKVFKDVIPVDNYQTRLINGEETGLVIELESKKKVVSICFGVVKAIRMLDEGIVLEGIYAENELERYEKNGFLNIIYQIHGGEFNGFVKKICGEFSEFLNLKHYIIITMNYNIEVITEWEPNVEVVDIKK